MGSTKGVPQLQKRLTAVSHAGGGILKAWQTAAVAYSKVYAPKRSGHLKQSIHPGVLSDLRATVETSAPYAAAQEFGSKPHEIRPVRAKVLAWGGARRLTGTLRAGSKPTSFARVVQHPGNPATHFMDRGAKRALDEVVKGHGPDLIKTAWNSGA
jgi:hypothetical protein